MSPLGIVTESGDVPSGFEVSGEWRCESNINQPQAADGVDPSGGAGKPLALPLP